MQFITYAQNFRRCGDVALPPKILDEFQLCNGHRLSYPVADAGSAQAELLETLHRVNLAQAQLAAIYGSRLWRVVRMFTALKGGLKRLNPSS